MDKINIDVKFNNDSIRPMRFLPGTSGEEMIQTIVSTNALVPRDDYVLYLPPHGSVVGKWLAKGEPLSRYLESTDLKQVGAIELRRTPHPVVVHFANDKELEHEEVLNSLHFTKRVVVDLSQTALDCMRELRVLFSSVLSKGNKGARDEMALMHYRPDPSTSSSSSTSWKLELLTLSHTLWEQGVCANDILVMYPLARLCVVNAKHALSNALFSGWLQPIKSEASAPSSTLRKTGKGASLRPAGRKKKLSFYVLRKSLLFYFKSDKAEKAESIFMLDYYRVSKVDWELGFVLRLDLKETNLSHLPSVVQLYAPTETEIDGWVRTINMSLKMPQDVFGVALHRVANRVHNFNQYAPDYLVALVEELNYRIDSDPDRWRCLVDADAKPPQELTKSVSSSRLPVFSSHPDMACAAALRAYLLSLPIPLCKPDLAGVLSRACVNDDLKLAASVVSLCTDTFHVSCLKIVLKTLGRVPLAQRPRVCDVFDHAVFGSQNNINVQNSKQLLEWLVLHVDTIMSSVSSTMATGFQMQNSSNNNNNNNNSGNSNPNSNSNSNSSLPSSPMSVSGSIPLENPLFSPRPTPSSPSNPSVPLGTKAMATVLYKFDSRSAKELSVCVGDVVCVLRESAQGWAHVSRLSDGVCGAVPSSYLSISSTESQGQGSQGASQGPSGGVQDFFSPRSTSMTKRTSVDRVLAMYDVFEKTALESIQEERRAKENMNQMLKTLESLAKQ